MAKRDELSSKKAELKRVTAEYEKTIDKVDALAKQASELYDKDVRDLMQQEIAWEDELDQNPDETDRAGIEEELDAVRDEMKTKIEQVDKLKKESQELYDGKGRDLYKKMIQLEDEIDQLEAIGSTKSKRGKGGWQPKHDALIDRIVKQFTDGADQRFMFVFDRDEESSDLEWRLDNDSYLLKIPRELKKELAGYPYKLNVKKANDHGSNPFKISVEIKHTEDPDETPPDQTKSEKNKLPTARANKQITSVGTANRTSKQVIEFSEAIRAKMVKFAQAVAEQLNGDDPLEQFGVEIPVRGRQSGKDWFTNIKQVERSAAAELKSIAPKGLVYSIDFKVESLSEPHGTLSISATRGPSNTEEPTWIVHAQNALEANEAKLTLNAIATKEAEKQLEIAKQSLKMRQNELYELEKEREILETANKLIQQELKKAGRSDAKRASFSGLKAMESELKREIKKIKAGDSVVIDFIVSVPGAESKEVEKLETDLVDQVEQLVERTLKSNGVEPSQIEYDVATDFDGENGYDVSIHVWGYEGDEERSAKRTKPNQSQIKQLANAVAKESDELKENAFWLRRFHSRAFD